MMKIELYSHQKKAINQMVSGSILCGGVGTGKSRTAIAYFYTKECGGYISSNGDLQPLKHSKDLYIITTAKKRDSLEWEKECALFSLSTNTDSSIFGIKVVVDSWNNIDKYLDIEDAFFIFDEQRVVGSGTWAKSFIKISKNNNWVLLSATPGDTWSDYISVFIANGFYKNRTEFLRRHVVYNRFSKYPKIERYIDTDHLEKLRRSIMIYMPFKKHTVKEPKIIKVSFDEELYKSSSKNRWNPFKELPIRDASEYCYTMRKIVNSDSSRLITIKDILKENEKVIIFYNFDYELEILSQLYYEDNLEVSQWNGHVHEEIPSSDRWVYLVQYNSGAEGWNCIETNCIVFFSLNYSYKIMAQASGRIDRLNTNFRVLKYYILKSNSPIDEAIFQAIKTKKNFNERIFYEN